MRAPVPAGLVAPVRIDPAGLRGPTRGAAQGRSWQRVGGGLLVPSARPTLVEQRVVEQGARLRRGAVTGWAALRMWGAGYFDGYDRDGRTPLRVAVVANGDRLRTNDRLVVLRSDVPESDVVEVHGVRVLRPLPALFDEMRRTGDLRDAVVAADMTAAARLSSVAAMRAHAETRRGARGVELVRDALGFAVDDSWSPMESRLRLIWVLDAKWDRPLCNPRVLDSGDRLIGRPDLMDWRRGLIGEYNGADHRGILRRRRDVGREDRFRRAGLEAFIVEGRDLFDVALVLDRMAAARERAGSLPQSWSVARARDHGRLTPLAPWERPA